MIKRNPIPFYVIRDNVNSSEFEKYDVMSYLIDCYKRCKKDKRPQTEKSCKEFIESKSQYMYWARCEYEIVLSAWVSGTPNKKIDIYDQIMNNINVVTHIFMLNVGLLKVV